MTRSWFDSKHLKISLNKLKNLHDYYPSDLKLTLLYTPMVCELTTKSIESKFKAKKIYSQNFII